MLEVNESHCQVVQRASFTEISCSRKESKEIKNKDFWTIPGVSLTFGKISISDSDTPLNIFIFHILAMVQPQSHLINQIMTTLKLFISYYIDNCKYPLSIFLIITSSLKSIETSFLSTHSPLVFTIFSLAYTIRMFSCVHLLAVSTF